MSFVGGGACGNVANTAILANTTVRRSAFYGRGARYQLLIYQQSGVRLEDVIFRSDGGWGQGSSTCTEFEPNAVLNNYNSSNFTCIGCILFDNITQAHNSSEVLGGLGVNCHNTSSTMLFENSMIVNSNAGFYTEGMGTCNQVTIRNSVANDNDSPFGLWGYNRNVNGSTALINFTTDGFCNTFNGSSTLTDSQVAVLNGCTGSTNGAGATMTLNTAFLNNPRWRKEMCTDAGVTRGWCATTVSLSEYLSSF
jgi:hypothetical protein